LVNETQCEIFRNGALWRWSPNAGISYDPPDDWLVDFQSHRWYKYFENGIVQKNDYIRLSYGRWICREFNKRNSGGEQLYKYSIFYVSRENNLDGTFTVNSPTSLWEHVCFDTRPDWNGSIAAANASDIAMVEVVIPDGSAKAENIEAVLLDTNKDNSGTVETPEVVHEVKIDGSEDNLDKLLNPETNRRP